MLFHTGIPKLANWRASANPPPKPTNLLTKAPAKLWEELWWLRFFDMPLPQSHRRKGRRRWWRFKPYPTKAGFALKAQNPILPIKAIYLCLGKTKQSVGKFGPTSTMYIPEARLHTFNQNIYGIIL